MIINFFEKKHYYTVEAPGIFEGALYQPGVTTIIGMKDKSAALVPWATGEMAKKLKEMIAESEPEHFTVATLSALVDAAKSSYNSSRQKAADIGTLAHGVFEVALKGGKPKLPLTLDPEKPHIDQDMVDQANNAVDAGLQFIREHEIEVVQAETPRWSPRYGYIGTGDLIARIDGELSVLDWKTSKRLYPTVRLQLSAYKQAYEEEYPNQEITQRVAVNTGKDGKLDPQFYGIDSHEDDLEMFLSLLKAWRWDRANQGDSRYNKEVPRYLTATEVSLISAA